MTEVRPLIVRLAEYAASTRSLSAQLLAVAEQAEALAKPGEPHPNTEPLRDGSRLYGLIANDLDKIVGGEELQPFVVEGGFG